MYTKSKPTTLIDSTLKPRHYKKTRCLCLWPHCWTSRHRPSSTRQRRRRHFICSTYRRYRTREKSWTPPINAHTLEELSILSLFKSIQLRHDLLLDSHLRFHPNREGPMGGVKRSQTERYWQRVDLAFQRATSYDFVRVIVKEIRLILASLIDPFNHRLPMSRIPWFWPPHITQAHIDQALDIDTIVQQLQNNDSLETQVEWLTYVLESMLKKGTPCVDRMVCYFQQGYYAKALQQCFSILEAIKLHCANLILVHHRRFLVETCAQFETHCFNNRPYSLSSVETWMEESRKRYGSKDTYYHGLVHLVVVETTTATADDEWPATLQFDKARLTGPLRKEFQQLMRLAITMIASYRGGVAVTDVDDALLQTPWLLNNLNTSSALYRIMCKRICHQLVHVAQQGTMRDCVSIDISYVGKEICALGKKLKLIADLNLQTYGPIYRHVICQSSIKFL